MCYYTRMQAHLCTDCKKEKLLDFFPKNKTKQGYFNQCKECVKKKRFLYFLNNPDKVKEKRFKNRLYKKKLRQDPNYVDPYTGTPKYKAMCIRHLKKWRSKPGNIKKKYIYEKVRLHIKAGKLKRLPCVICGDLKSRGHHEDYNKPLELIWLCATHHAHRHNGLLSLEDITK